MDRNFIDRRHFLAAAGALAAIESPGRTHRMPLGGDPRVAWARGVTQVQLVREYTCSRQEGGKTVMSGTLIPKAKQVVIDVDIAATFGGWGGGAFDFHVGVLPSKPPAPWEPGVKNQIVLLNNAARTPLPGVTEYHHFPIGIVSANVIATRTGRTIVLDDLTVDRVYQWELRSGGLSFFKLYTFENGARPMSLAVTPDNLYVWVACEGNNRLALVQLGWAELWPLYGYSQEMLCIAEIQLDGKPGGITVQPAAGPFQAPVNRPGSQGQAATGPFLATVNRTKNQLVIVDTSALAVAGLYTPSFNVPLSGQRVIWSLEGDKVYLGGAADGTLHSFDLAQRKFDRTTVIDPASRSAIIPLALSADGRYLWCSSYQNGKIFQVDLRATAPQPRLVYTMPAGPPGPTCSVVRKGDGSILFFRPGTNYMLHVSATGTLLKTWPVAPPAWEVPPHARCSLHLDADEVRLFWTHGGSFGWTWVDSGRIINVIRSGPATQRWFPDKICGEMALTSDEGTLLTLPSSHKIIQWPGGTIRIHPSQNDPVGYGAEHALVTFTGAEATRE